MGKNLTLEEIYAVYAKDLYRYVFSLCKNEAQAEDIVQETFYRAYFYAETFQEGKIKSWLFKVAYHTFIDLYRKEKKLTYDKTYTIDEVYELLDGYDFNIEWYCIQTAANRTSDSPYIYTGNGTWGLHEQSVFDFSVDDGSIMIRGDGEKREAAFKKGLAFLVDNEKYVKQYGWWIDQEDLNLAEKLAYVEEHGVKTYGLVVTGPTKELLRLQEVEPIIFATIGEVAFWNWTTRNAGSSFSN